jgi:hypothetical protein
LITIVYVINYFAVRRTSNIVLWRWIYNIVIEPCSHMLIYLRATNDNSGKAWVVLNINDLNQYQIILSDIRHDGLVWFMVLNVNFNNISVISWRCFIVGGWNRSTRRRPPSCHKSLTTTWRNWFYNRHTTKHVLRLLVLTVPF